MIAEIELEENETYAPCDAAFFNDYFQNKDATKRHPDNDHKGIFYDFRESSFLFQVANRAANNRRPSLWRRDFSRVFSAYSIENTLKVSPP